MYLNLTDKQVSILKFIEMQIEEKKYPPAIREICIALNIKSPSTVHTHLNKLENLGYIRREPTRPRAITLNKEKISKFNSEIIYVPILKYIVK